MDLATRDRLGRRLKNIVGEPFAFSDAYEVRLYQYDASPETALPDIVVIPGSAHEVAQVLKACADENVPVTARSGASSLAGGTVPVEGGVIVTFARMDRLLEIDTENLRAVVEPGMVNIALSQALKPHGFYYVPDPSSQGACTIGGNVGTNAGGPHTLIYGVTVNHVTGLEVALSSGELVQVGGRKAAEATGYDLTGLLVGSEGTMGVVTKIWVKLTPIPPVSKTLLAVYPDVATASNAVSAVVGGGILPAAIEMMDHLSIQAVEAASHAGYPLDAGAVLLLEVDSIPDVADELVERMDAICRQQGATEVRVAKNEAERQALWKGRKGAFSAMGRLSPDFYVMDGVVPRTKLPQTMEAIAGISERTGFKICNVFHAGDGNLHPLVLFDAFKAGQYEAVLAIGDEILKLCAEAGGSVTGEHGIGLEKRENIRYIFSEDDLEVMDRIRRVFDPHALMNPGKLFPANGPRPSTSAHPAGHARRQAAPVTAGEDVWV
ncbi:MAG TPA: FAD-linked oxidase C-terminal domain-containing protein [Candidatus Dormibacteraeota bacterium]|nr:FAD-linked oxidase C-terminal domain-containing protein [Candidatus Dormibacteraeota bacterium]